MGKELRRKKKKIYDQIYASPEPKMV